MNARIFGAAVAALALTLSPSRADVLENPAAQAKVDAMISAIAQLAASPVIVSAVEAHNASLSAEEKAMTQNGWTELNVVDPFIRKYATNAAADLLRTKKPEWASELFLNDAKGLKVAFLSKTTYWCHAGKAKHDVPMTGKTWQGKISVDQSTGIRELQISVPVLSDGKPIGSLVAGIDITKL